MPSPSTHSFSRGFRKKAFVRRRQPIAQRSSVAVYFDLIGLPPSPAEVRAFVADKSPQAYEHLIDHLLASPQYGERWGAHWLDVVRFAESDGFEYDTHRTDAWRYRDYVIRAFNQDKPYDKFLIEQLAGDETLARRSGTASRRRLPAPGSVAQERRKPGSRQQPQRSAHRDDQRRRVRSTWRHSGLRPLPRSQIRSHPPHRLLPHAGLLRCHPRQEHFDGDA